MSVEEMRKVINKKVESLNEDQLQIILKIIGESEDEQKKSKFDAESFFSEVVAKYGSVLQKLAQ
ncbi:MAG: hypothetical protein ABI863_05905 [Ginsengibacter sp.]